MAAAAVVARIPLLVNRERLVEGNGVGHDNNGNHGKKVCESLACFARLLVWLLDPAIYCWHVLVSSVASCSTYVARWGVTRVTCGLV